MPVGACLICIFVGLGGIWVGWRTWHGKGYDAKNFYSVLGSTAGNIPGGIALILFGLGSLFGKTGFYIGAVLGAPFFAAFILYMFLYLCGLGAIPEKWMPPAQRHFKEEWRRKHPLKPPSEDSGWH